MTISTLLNQGASYLKQTGQEVTDIYRNGCFLYKHGDLATHRPKIFSRDEYFETLEINPATHRFSLFVLRDHSLQPHTLESDRLLVELAPRVHNPSSLTRVFIEESGMRAAKAVAVLAITLLSSPVWLPALAATSCCKNTPAPSFSLPREPLDSHVTKQDILRIGPSLIGYRHVSSEKHAQDNAANGFKQGCSLNISFCAGEGSNKSKFKLLNLRIQKGENCEALIKDYEVAITDFIQTSINLDHPPALTYGDILASLDQTRFMIVKTHWHSAADVHSYGNLGRWPKENVDAEGITLLRRITKKELFLPSAIEQKQINSREERTAFISYIASHYRRELLRYIREDFDPKRFGRSYDSAYLEVDQLRV